MSSALKLVLAVAAVAALSIWVNNPWDTLFAKENLKKLEEGKTLYCLEHPADKNTVVARHIQVDKVTGYTLVKDTIYTNTLGDFDLLYCKEDHKGLDTITLEKK